jgi:hypothetical protein
MVVLEVPKEHSGLARQLTELEEGQVTIGTLKRFGGESDILQVVVALSPLTIPFIAKVIVEYIRAQQSVVVKYRGVEIRGLSAENVKSVLTQILADKQGKEGGK